MDDKINKKQVLRNFKFVLISQAVALVLSILKSIALPKILSVPDYGYWQVYVLYSSYAGIFALGFNDGVYLKYGKYQYNELPHLRLRTATRFYLLMLLLFSLISFALCFVFIDGEERRLAILGVSLDIFIMGINGLLIYVLQITNRIKEYSICSVLDKAILLIGVLIICFVPNCTYLIVEIVDLFSKIVVTILLIYMCKDFFLGNVLDLKEGYKEFLDDIKIGISLMIANLMGMLITGIGRIVVDIMGNISEYAFYSFGITITNLVLVFISAVSLVLYPTMKRLPESNYTFYYNKMNVLTQAFICVALFSYFPVVIFIDKFLPHYSSLFSYIHFLFCVVGLQAKMQLINNTFYKVLRKEKELLRANMMCVVLFSILASILFGITRTIYSIALCTFIAMLYRCYASEYFIRKNLNIKIGFTYWLEIVSIVLFAVLISFIPFIPALIVSFACVSCFFIILLKRFRKAGFFLNHKKY